jgi:hypothetical protein
MALTDAQLDRLPWGSGRLRFTLAYWRIRLFG